LDGLSPDPLADWAAINAELAAFGHGLAEKPQVVVLTKLDLPQVRERWPQLRAQLEAQGLELWAISALAREGTQELMRRVAGMLAGLPPVAPAHAVPVFRLGEDEEAFSVEQEADGWRVRGVAVERLAAITVWNLDEAVRRFQRALERLGVTGALEEAGVRPGDTVRIGERELVWEE
jgi:GTP-binding protein